MSYVLINIVTHIPDGSTFISCVRKANSCSSRYSFKPDNDYNLLSLSTSLSSEAIKEICLSGPPLEMEVHPYHFEPDLPSTTDCDIDDRVHLTTVFESSLVDRMGNTD